MRDRNRQPVPFCLQIEVRKRVRAVTCLAGAHATDCEWCCAGAACVLAGNDPADGPLDAAFHTCHQYRSRLQRHKVRAPVAAPVLHALCALVGSSRARFNCQMLSTGTLCTQLPLLPKV